MAKRVFSRTRSSRKRTSEFSSVSDGGMFASRPFVVQSKVGEAGEKSGLKTSLMRAERYGHQLSQMQAAEIPFATAVQPKMVMEQSVQLKQAEVPPVQLAGDEKLKNILKKGTGKTKQERAYSAINSVTNYGEPTEDIDHLNAAFSGSNAAKNREYWGNQARTTAKKRKSTDLQGAGDEEMGRMEKTGEFIKRDAGQVKDVQPFSSLPGGHQLTHMEVQRYLREPTDNVWFKDGSAHPPAKKRKIDRSKKGKHGWVNGNHDFDILKDTALDTSKFQNPLDLSAAALRRSLRGTPNIDEFRKIHNSGFTNGQEDLSDAAQRNKVSRRSEEQRNRKKQLHLALVKAGGKDASGEPDSPKLSPLRPKSPGGTTLAHGTSPDTGTLNKLGEHPRHWYKHLHGQELSPASSSAMASTSSSASPKLSSARKLVFPSASATASTSSSTSTTTKPKKSRKKA